MSVFQLGLGFGRTGAGNLKVGGKRFTKMPFEIAEKAATICGKSF
jgi:hypothetical protein